MRSSIYFFNGLVAIPEEPLAAIATLCSHVATHVHYNGRQMAAADLQFSDDLIPCPVTELLGLSSEGRIANDGQQTCVHLLGAGLTRKEGAELCLRGKRMSQVSVWNNG